MVYSLLKAIASICFNLLNLLLMGNLPPLGAVNVVVESEGRFLVVRTARGTWSFPGGFIRWRETPLEAAVRECEEETGLHIRAQSIIGCYWLVSASPTQMSSLTTVVCGEVTGGRLRPSIEGEPLWLEREEALRRLGEETRAIFADYERFLAGQAIGTGEQARERRPG
ncbi:NUDIX hydrolase [Thermogemmatispora sp.]|uniref:NUDIX hydrolase n=1 Tax=Thermogemmatispora sp. TaxID=1968838 RepID=UPI0035E464B3